MNGRRAELARLVLVAAALCAGCIVQDPLDQVVMENQTATFTVLVSGAGPTSYQWEQSDDGGSTWANISGATNASYTTPPTTLANDGTQFRCTVSDNDGVFTSLAATLTVEPGLGGWWEVYVDDPGGLVPLVALEFEYVGLTVRYLDVVMTLEGDVVSGTNGGGLGFALTVIDNDTLQGALIVSGYPMDIVLIRHEPSGTQSAHGGFAFDSTTSYGCAGAAGSDVYFVSVDHMGCDRSVMVEIETGTAPLQQGTYSVGGDVAVGIHVEDIIDGQYAYSCHIANGGSITFANVDTTRATGTYSIATVEGETITGSFDVPVFVTLMW